MDQRESRGSADFVAEWQPALNRKFSPGMLLPFVRTAGDEMQALFTAPEALLDVVVQAIDSRRWWLGIGVGDPDPVGETARESRGPAFHHARRAIEEAKTRSWRCAAAGDPQWLAEAADGMLAVLVHVRDSRTDRANDLVNRAMAGARQVDIARELGISPQAVSKQLKNAGYEQERRGRDAIVQVLRQVER